MAMRPVERRYVAIVAWMAHRPRSMATVFFMVVGMAVVAFGIYPSTLVPLEDQGYCIVVAQLPAGASQPRVREVADEIDARLKQASGIRGWVTIGGYSALDAAKLSTELTEFVVFDEWSKRPPGMTQAKIIAQLQRLLALRSAQVGVLPPSPIPGLGNAFGFQMIVEDRGGAGLGELQKSVRGILRNAHNRPGFLRIGFTTFSAEQPATLSRCQPHHGAIARSRDQRHFEDAADQSWLDLREPFQQVQPEFSGSRPGRGWLSKPDRRHRESLCQ